MSISADRLSSVEDAVKLGLTDEEFSLITEKLNRTPTFTEMAMFSGMWSEHCSYKNSILLLKDFYSESDRLLARPGEENAGALKINDKQAVVFKIESHNHPSAVEPYQGAATGVGGIMRDIFTMGARPILSLNSLRFGLPDKPRNRYLLRQVVKGIGDYGNSLGIACGGGEIYFDESFTKNPLVNAMTVGIADIENLASARASGPGNLVFYVGAKTGRDGIHGASFASKELSEESEEERSAVQVGDPFMEKQVMEATLECIERKLVVAVQDMGAAGLVSSSSEMSASGGVGMNLYIDRVPAREENMVPFEFMLSESQERMLMVVKPENKQHILDVFEKWELDAAVIGEITDSGNLKIFFNDEVYADVPAALLADEAPRYRREVSRPAPVSDSVSGFKAVPEAISRNDAATLEKEFTMLLSHPNFASRHPVYEQYDTDIGASRVIGPGQNAGVYKIPESEQSIAVTVDGNSYYVSIDPYEGARFTVAESYRNLVSAGAEPIGITNCLNFANPYKPENYYFFQNAVKGISDSAEAFKIPVTGGNVSFYNESEDGPVLPTPTIGMVGLHKKHTDTVPASVENSQVLILAGYFSPAIGHSQYAYIKSGRKAGLLPELKIENEILLGRFLIKQAREKKIKGAIDLSSGGLFYALFRLLSASTSRFKAGFVFDNIKEVQSIAQTDDSDTLLFGESAASALIAIEPEQVSSIEKESTVPLLRLGTVDDSGQIQFTPLCRVQMQPLLNAYHKGLADFF